VANARDRIIAELVEDFIEERVRHSSKKAFDLPAVKKGLQENLKGTEAAMELASSADRVIVAALDRHPFVVRAAKGPTIAWKPGLDISRADPLNLPLGCGGKRARDQPRRPTHSTDVGQRRSCLSSST
jgi:hypothetical protein